jgi:hypothetical protein
VREGALSIEVDSVDVFRARMEQEVSALGGHIADASVEHADGKTSSGKFTLRLPQDKLDAFAAKCRAWGVVTQEDLRTKEITAEYYDEAARLTNARKLEQRLLSLMSGQANNVKDLLEVERELARVREQIETFEGHIRLYDNQVALSTLVLNVMTKERFVAAAPPSFLAQAGGTLSSSAQALKQVGRGLTLALVALLPWLPVGVGLWFLARRLRRRRA